MCRLGTGEYEDGFFSERQAAHIFPLKTSVESKTHPASVSNSPEANGFIDNCYSINSSGLFEMAHISQMYYVHLNWKCPSCICVIA